MLRFMRGGKKGQELTEPVTKNVHSDELECDNSEQEAEANLPVTNTVDLRLQEVDSVVKMENQKPDSGSAAKLSMPYESSQSYMSPDYYEYHDILPTECDYEDVQETPDNVRPMRLQRPTRPYNEGFYSVPRRDKRPPRPLRPSPKGSYLTTPRRHATQLRTAYSDPQISPSKNKRQDLRVSFRDEDSLIQDTFSFNPKDKMATGKDMQSDDDLSMTSETSDISESDLRPRRFRRRRTFAMGLVWFAMGLFTEMIGVQTEYLRSGVNASFAEMSYPLISRSAGAFLGSALGGILCQLLPHFSDLWTGVAMILASVGMAAAPWCHKLIYLTLALGVTGLARGTLIVSCLSALCELWSAYQYPVIVFSLYLCYAMGAAASSQLTFLFESGALNNLGLFNIYNKTLFYKNGHMGETYNTTAHPGDTIPQMMYSFDLVAIFSFFLGSVFLVLSGFSLASATIIKAEIVEKVKEARRENLKPVNWFAGHKLPGARIICFILVFFVLPCVSETVFGHWLGLLTDNDYSVNSTWQRPMCLLIQTVYWASVTVGRLLTLVAHRCLSSNGLMVTCSTMTLISSVMLCVYVHKFAIFLWIFVITQGLFSSVFIPAGLTYCNIFVSHTAMGVGVLICLSSLAEGLASWQTAFLFHHYQPSTLLYLSAAASVLAFISYLPLIPALSDRKWQPQNLSTNHSTRGTYRKCETKTSSTNHRSRDKYQLKQNFLDKSLDESHMKLNGHGMAFK